MLEPRELWGPGGPLRPISTSPGSTTGGEITDIALCGDVWRSQVDSLTHVLLVVPEAAEWPETDPARRLEELVLYRAAGIVAAPVRARRLAAIAQERALSVPVLAPAESHDDFTSLPGLLQGRLRRARHTYTARIQRILELSGQIHHRRQGPGALLEWLAEQIAPARVLLLDGGSGGTGGLDDQIAASGLSVREAASLKDALPALERVGAGSTNSATWTTSTHHVEVLRVGMSRPYQLLLTLSPARLPGRMQQLIVQAGNQIALLEQQRRGRDDQNTVRAQVFQQLLAGQIVPAQRAAEDAGCDTVPAGLLEASAVEVCVLETQPRQDPVRRLTAACEDALRGRCLVVPQVGTPDRLVVVHPVEDISGGGEAVASLRQVVGAASCRVLGVSPPVEPARIRRGVELAAEALTTARQRPDRIASVSGLPENLPPGIASWAHQLLLPVYARYYADEHAGPSVSAMEKLAQCRAVLAQGPKWAAETSSLGLSANRLTQVRAEIADLVGLPRTVRGYAVLHLALQVAERPTTTVGDDEVPTLAALLATDEAQRHAAAMLGDVEAEQQQLLATWLHHDAHSARTADAYSAHRNTIRGRVRNAAKALQGLPVPLSESARGRYELAWALAARGARTIDDERFALPDPTESHPFVPMPTRPVGGLPDAGEPEEHTIAGVYAYLLGARRKIYVADANLATQIERVFPAKPCAAAVQEFLGRSIRYSARHGIRQVLDLGCGLPTHPGPHWIAAEAAPGARYVAVDVDREVVQRTQAYLRANPHPEQESACCFEGDVTAVDDTGGASILAAVQEQALLDLHEPTLLLLGALPSFLPPPISLREVVFRLMEPLAVGSIAVIAQATTDFAGQTISDSAQLWVSAGHPISHLTRAETEQTLRFEGVVLEELQAAQRALGGDSVAGDSEVGMYGAVVRKVAAMQSPEQPALSR